MAGLDPILLTLVFTAFGAIPLGLIVLLLVRSRPGKGFPGRRAR